MSTRRVGLLGGEAPRAPPGPSGAAAASSSGNRLPSRSLNWTPISSMPCGVKIDDRAAPARRRELDLDLALVELALRAACGAASRASRRSRRLRRRPGDRSRRRGAAAARRAGAPRRAPRALRAHLALLLLGAPCCDGELGEVADDRLDVAADVADLGELRRLDLDERRLRELREPARDLGLPDAGRPDHDDVLGRDLVAQLARAPAGGASGCAARSRPRAWRRAGRRCSGRARRRSRAA